MTDLTRVLICGLPESGKTTYIGALWHCISSEEKETALVYDGLPEDREYLNQLASKWLQFEEIDHTRIEENKRPEMKFRLKDESFTLTFPDHSGEIWRDLWETRHCPERLVTLASQTMGILLFIHADRIKHPMSVVEMAAQSKELGEGLEAGQEVPYTPDLAPTQVKLVDILQLLAVSPFNLRNKPLSIILSAWDKVEADNLTPEVFLKEKLPLLDQFLKNNMDFNDWSIYGVSAIGGDLKKKQDLDSLKKIQIPSERIKVIEGEHQSHDLTLPVLRLMGSG